MTYTDHKTFWLLIAVMIGVPSILFVLALLKATTKDPFVNLPKQSRGVAATAKISGSETGITVCRESALQHGSDRLPGGARLQLCPIVEKAGSARKTGYVPADDNRQVPRPTIQFSAVQLTKILRKI